MWCLLAAWPAVVGAAEPASSTGISISPFYSEVAVKTGDQQVTVPVSIHNASGTDLMFKLSAVDFGSLDEEGGVAFLGQPASELEHKYGLAAWMTLSADELTVPSGQSAAVKVTIANRPTLSPGGHYGAVLATAMTDTTAGQPAPRVGVRQVLSSLLLTTKDGANQYRLRLESVKLDGAWWRLPAQIDQRYSNQGNVHVVPRGVVEVRDPLGRVVRRGALNDASSVILPGATRHVRTALDQVAPAWLPGPYRVVTHYRPDTVDATQQDMRWVWYAGTLVMWAAILGAVLVIWFLVWWLWWRPNHRVS